MTGYVTDGYQTSFSYLQQTNVCVFNLCKWFFTPFVLAVHFQCSKFVLPIWFLLVLWNDFVAGIYSQIHSFGSVSACIFVNSPFKTVCIFIHSISVWYVWCMYVCMYGVHIYIRMHVCMYCMYVCMYVCMCMYVRTCIRMYVCTYVYVCMYACIVYTKLIICD